VPYSVIFGLLAPEFVFLDKNFWTTRHFLTVQNVPSLLRATTLPILGIRSIMCQTQLFCGKFHIFELFMPKMLRTISRWGSLLHFLVPVADSEAASAKNPGLYVWPPID